MCDLLSEFRVQSSEFRVQVQVQVQGSRSRSSFWFSVLGFSSGAMSRDGGAASCGTCSESPVAIGVSAIESTLSGGGASAATSDARDALGFGVRDLGFGIRDSGFVVLGS